MGLKPKYILFYNDEEVFKRVQNTSPFREQPIHVKDSKEETYIEYHHFVLQAFKCESLWQKFRGYKCFGILVEKEVWENTLKEGNDILTYGMLNPNGSIIGFVNIVE